MRFGEHTRARARTHTHAHTHTHARARTHTHTHTHTHAHTHTRTHTHTQTAESSAETPVEPEHTRKLLATGGHAYQMLCLPYPQLKALTHVATQLVHFKPKPSPEA